MNSPETVESNIPAEEDEISLLNILIVLAKHKKKVLGLPLAAAIMSAGISLMLPNVYTATTKIMPPQQGQSAATAMLAQLGSLAAGSATGLKNPNDLYIGMLKSRPVADNLVQRFELQKRYGQQLTSGARAILASKTNISTGKDGIITIDFDDTDPKMAADIANAYADELYKLTRVLAVTEASQRRLFFERQLSQARENVAHAQVAARQALNQGGVANVDVQGRAMLETTARLRGQISAKEVQIAAMRGFAADRNPDLIKAQQELAAMKAELAKAEGLGSTGAQIAAGTQGLENQGRLRDLKYYEAVYEMLAKQYEIAKIDEAKDSSIIQVMEKAIEPDRKSKPKRGMIVMISALAGVIGGVLWAFMSESLEKMVSNPATLERLRMFRGYCGLRR